MKDAGVKVVDVKIVPKQGHGFIGEAAEQASAEAWAFMDQYVKNRTATTSDDEVVYRDLASLTPSDDAVIDSSKPTVNFNSATGSSNGLFSISSGAENKKYVYFKFDVSSYSNPANRYIFNVAAKKGSSNADLELSLFGLKDTNWTESELTWSNAPVTDLTIASLSGKFTVTADKSGAPQVYSIDVSEFVRDRLSASGGNIAFLLGDTASTGISSMSIRKKLMATATPVHSLLFKKRLNLQVTLRNLPGRMEVL